MNYRTIFIEIIHTKLHIILLLGKTVSILFIGNHE